MTSPPVCLADLWDIPDPDPRTSALKPKATGDGLATYADWVLAVIDQAVAEVRAQGVDVRFLDGWADRGRPSYFEPGGAVDHHTGGPAWSVESQWWSMLYLVRDGRSDLNGPLANVCTWPDGTLWIVAAGTCNHAGPGGWNGLAGNYSVWGNELVHSGGPNEEWPEAQLRSALLWDVALARHTGYGAEMVSEHKEWSNAGKIDRINIDGDERRARIAELLAGGQPEEDWMALTEDEQRELLDAVREIRDPAKLAGQVAAITAKHLFAPLGASQPDRSWQVGAERLGELAESRPAVTLSEDDRADIAYRVAAQLGPTIATQVAEELAERLKQ